MPKLPKSLVPTTSIYQKLIKAIKASGAKVISAKVGDTYTLGDAKITIVGPVGTPEDLNNASVVMKVSTARIRSSSQAMPKRRARKRFSQTARISKPMF